MTKIELEKYIFEASESGQNFTVLGAVHGNEKCGPKGIRRILQAIDDGKITIKSGSVTFMPICNPRAYDEDVRFIERNLNRFMYPKDNPEKYEDHIDNVLCPVLKNSDYVLDLHSYTSKGGAFIFLENLDEKNVGFANCLGVPRIVYGWADAMQGSDDLEDKRQAMGTTEYAREFGATALTLECGNHTHPRGADIAFQAILNALEYLEIAEVDESLHIRDLPDDGNYNIRMQGAYLKLRDGDFIQDWKHMDFLEAGTVVARYEDGEELSMPKDGYVVLPKRDTHISHEWFYWGIEDKIKAA